jgi:hypothetical protein
MGDLLLAILTRTYLIERAWVLLLAGICGLGFFVFLMVDPWHNRSIFPSILIVQILLCAPYNLKTAVGRLWWSTYIFVCLGGIGAVLLGIHNPLSWVIALLAAGAYAVGVCLRWKPPTV